MLPLNDLVQAVDAYRSGDVSLDEFADWYDRASLGKFGESANVLEVCMAIDFAFSSLQFENISEEQFRQELDEAIRPYLADVEVSEAAQNLQPFVSTATTTKPLRKQPIDVAWGDTDVNSSVTSLSVNWPLEASYAV
jgi:hypothetical protein